MSTPTAAHGALPEAGELLPCPFCRGTNLFKSRRFDGAEIFRIGCNDCNVAVEDYIKQSAISIWNSRAALSPASPAPAVPSDDAQRYRWLIENKLIPWSKVVGFDFGADIGIEDAIDYAMAGVAPCDTCRGLGTIDETLGGEYFSNPKAKCPDCDGTGERRATPAQQTQSDAVAGPELLLGWTRYEKARKLNPRQWTNLHARNVAGEHFDSMIDALPEPSTPVPGGGQ